LQKLKAPVTIIESKNSLIHLATKSFVINHLKKFGKALKSSNYFNYTKLIVTKKLSKAKDRQVRCNKKIKTDLKIISNHQKGILTIHKTVFLYKVLAFELEYTIHKKFI